MGQIKTNVSELCALFEVSRSGYYAHLRKAQGQRRQQDQQLAEQMEVVFEASRATYGSPRLVDALREQGLRCGKNRIRRLMREQGLQAKQKRRRRPCTTRSNPSLPVAANVVAAMTAPTAINQQWVSDITYIATEEGWLYLAGTLDRYSRRLVGWQGGMAGLNQLGERRRLGCGTPCLCLTATGQGVDLPFRSGLSVCQP